MYEDYLVIAYIGERTYPGTYNTLSAAYGGLGRVEAPFSNNGEFTAPPYSSSTASLSASTATPTSQPYTAGAPFSAPTCAALQLAPWLPCPSQSSLLTAAFESEESYYFVGKHMGHCYCRRRHHREIIYLVATRIWL